MYIDPRYNVIYIERVSDIIIYIEILIKMDDEMREYMFYTCQERCLCIHDKRLSMNYWLLAGGLFIVGESDRL